MPGRRRVCIWLLGATLLPGLDAHALAQSDADKERFLLEAEVVHARGAPGGLNGSVRATLRRGSRVHDADVQLIDETSPERRLGSSTELDFRDSWRNNVAAYRIDRLLGLRMVPVTVIRAYDEKRAAFSWRLDDAMMSERERNQKGETPPDASAWNRQVQVARIFDQLIYNFDRNPRNLVIDRGWQLWMTDHTRAFKVFKDLRDEKQLPDSCPRALLAALRKLDEPTLKTRAGGLLGLGQIEGLLARRDQIVAHYEHLIAVRGEAAVLYEPPARR